MILSAGPLRVPGPMRCFPLPGGGFVVGQQAGHQGGDLDFGGVAADGFAVSVEDVDLFLEQLDGHAAAGPAVEVQDVAVHGEGPQGAPGAGAADEDRDWGVEGAG